MYRPNFYNKFHGNDATFHNNYQPHFVPPPPVPPAFFIPPILSTENLDQEFVTRLETKIPVKQSANKVVNSLSISDVREELRKVIVAVNDLKSKETYLTENIHTLSETEWNMYLKEIEDIKVLINKTLTYINSPLLDELRKCLAKRAAKRLRMKRVHKEFKREKEEKKKELEERSRKIDENLQKVKDDIISAQQEQESKIKADIVLKEVLRKKHDAKKCIMKLDALAKLRKARQNTAKGRGEIVSESETTAFNTTIEKLKFLWTEKLSSYNKEEADLRVKLKEDSDHIDTNTSATEKVMADTLNKWQGVLFGGQLPQVDFKGDIGQFLAVRSQWDQYINKDGTNLPVGWVPPSL